MSRNQNDVERFTFIESSAPGTVPACVDSNPSFFSVSLVEAAKDASVDKAREHLDAFLHAVKDAQFLLLGDRIVSIDRRADGVVSIKIAPMKEE